MSLRSDISKLIGWDAQHVDIPTAKQAMEWVVAAQKGDQGAYMTIFRTLRFAQPRTDASLFVVNLLVLEESKMRHLFE